MSEHIEELREAMDEIIEGGWYKSTRKGPTGIGKTFEDLLKKEEDNHDLPDFHDIEIKTHEASVNALITLFTKSPTNPRGANSYLRENYGKLNEYGLKKLHATVIATKKTNSLTYDYDFQIKVDWENELIILNVFDKDNNVVDDSIFWSFESLEKQITKKLKYVAVIHTESKIVENEKYYNYKSAKLLRGLNVHGLCKGIENGDVKVDIRIGVYNSGKNKGKTHDHGTAFRIFYRDLFKYGETEIIKEK